MYGDVRDAKHLHSVVVDHAVDWVVNYSALLSAAAEKNFLQALEVLASDQTVCQSVGMGLLVMRLACDSHVIWWSCNPHVILIELQQYRY